MDLVEVSSEGQVEAKRREKVVLGAAVCVQAILVGFPKSAAGNDGAGV